MNSKNNIIIEELKEIAPRLADIQRVNPFSVPVHYFESLPDELMQKVQVESDLLVLNSLKKDNGFDVPYNYFESLPGKILDRVREEDNKPSLLDKILNKAGFLLNPKYALASIALLAGIIFFMNRMNNNEVRIPTLASAEKQISVQDVSDYVSSNIDQFDEKSIVACVSNNELDNAPFPMKAIDTLTISNQNLIDINQIDDNTINEISM